MTDEEVDNLLSALMARRVAAWQQGKLGPGLPGGVPEGTEADICAITWHIGMKPSRDGLLAAGATVEQVEAALAARKRLLDIIEPDDLVPIPPDLAEDIDRDLRAALLEESDDLRRRLDEKHVDWITEHRVEIYLNEGQHRGRPHVAVVLPDGKVSISLDDSPVLLTPHGYREEASALKVVRKHLSRLRKLWDDTRPDDQKLPEREQREAPPQAGEGKPKKGRRGSR